MTTFQLSQFEHELFQRYFSCLRAFFAHCYYYVGKWEILDIVNKGVSSKTSALLGYQGFHGKNVDETWYLLEWIAWDIFEFEKTSCLSGYSFPDPCVLYSRSYYAPFQYDLCNSPNHATNSRPYYA